MWVSPGHTTGTVHQQRLGPACPEHRPHHLPSSPWLGGTSILHGQSQLGTTLPREPNQSGCHPVLQRHSPTVAGPPTMASTTRPHPWPSCACLPASHTMSQLSEVRMGLARLWGQRAEALHWDRVTRYHHDTAPYRARVLSPSRTSSLEAGAPLSPLSFGDWQAPVCRSGRKLMAGRGGGGEGLFLPKSGCGAWSSSKEGREWDLPTPTMGAGSPDGRGQFKQVCSSLPPAAHALLIKQKALCGMASAPSLPSQPPLPCSHLSSCLGYLQLPVPHLQPTVCSVPREQKPAGPSAVCWVSAVHARHQDVREAHEEEAKVGLWGHSPRARASSFHTSTLTSGPSSLAPATLPPTGSHVGPFTSPPLSPQSRL